MAYKLISNDKNARAGLLSINNIEVQTPTFMPVATRGAIKSTPQQYLDKTSILLANAYHLHLRPGAQLINDLGGLHKFMNWDKLILTDSGGFQAWSLPTKLLNDGIEFKNVYDGSFFKMTPEESINTQNLLGSDIAMIFDYLIDYDRSDDDQMKAIEITSQWAEKAKNVHKNNKQDLFGIVQGGLNLDLRETSAKSMIELDFDGYAIGGLAIGESSTERKKVVEHLNSILPIDKPRYVMGVGMPEDLLMIWEHGVDMSDCIIPTKFARGGTMFTNRGKIRITHKNYKIINRIIYNFLIFKFIFR